MIVVIYRVLMVCHVDVGYKYGEKRIRDMLMRFQRHCEHC